MNRQLSAGVLAVLAGAVLVVAGVGLVPRVAATVSAVAGEEPYTPSPGGSGRVPVPPATPSASGLASTASAVPSSRASAPVAASVSAAAVPVPSSASSCGGGAQDATVVRSGDTWTASRAGRTVYTGADTRSAIQAGIDSLTPGRTVKERVVVRGSGSVSAAARIKLHSYTTIDVCGTIDVVGAGATDMAPVFARDVTDIEVQHLKVTGTPMYGIFLRDVTNVKLGRIDMRLSGGLGVRIDNGSTGPFSKNIVIDDVYVSGAGSHAVETAGVDGLTIGTVTARDVGEAGLLLNTTINATIGTVDAANTGTGTGYAAFRMANRNGRVGDAYPSNITVGLVKARGGGRGIFCVSESGGARIGRVDIADTGGNAILLENCYNTTIATRGGTITGGGEIRLASRRTFAPSRDLTLGKLTIVDNHITEAPCVAGLTITDVEVDSPADIRRC
ncbi:hypothetical protein [Actinoplanes sp. NBRC 101535]|uniref:hypothetical protein n=1 Tax=Actinoplanes sp. NBRC 101535 TaxID=3032196 RepID=UPI002554708A|nr:hypothetical protein [Actinoplanes sp. NBRC 101535]